MDQPATTVAECEQVLVETHERLGEHHPDTLAARRNLATLYRRARRFHDAGNQLEALLTALRATRGDEDEQTLVAEEHLAAVRRRRWHEVAH